MEKLFGKEKVCSLFEKLYETAPSSISVLPRAGSDRIYFRLFLNKDLVETADGNHFFPYKSVIGVFGPDIRENRSFVSLARCMKRFEVPVPEIYAVSDDWKCYLQQDLGETSLYSLLGVDNNDIERSVRLSLQALVRLQTVPVENWNELVFNAPFSKRQVLWDLNYFKYEYLKNTRADYNEDLLEDDFEALASDLCNISNEEKGFMYRDFQSRNIMIKDKEPFFIDFQGGRLGPCLYDAVSFLWQAKAGWSPDFRGKMIDYYADCFCAARKIKKELFLSNLDRLVLFRTLQVLGAYGFRGLVQKRAHFLESIPGALCNVRDIMNNGVMESYPELERVCRQLANDGRFISDSDQDHNENKTLTCEVFSFSYKRGYPDDFSGNGGGFMFDCRGMHNPGRYEQYKTLTGRDKEVIDFLEQRGEVQPFVNDAFNMVRRSVETYQRRGFSKLQIGFGCTGGQHRSVFCADNFARMMKRCYPDVNVVIRHREQEIEEVVR